MITSLVFSATHMIVLGLRILNIHNYPTPFLSRLLQIVYQMVQVYGMNDKIGQVAFPKEDGQWPTDRLYRYHNPLAIPVLACRRCYFVIETSLRQSASHSYCTNTTHFSQ